MKQFLIIQMLLCFGWLSSIALAQLDISGAISGSASFPHVGITCLGNLAVFITSFLRKRLDLEMGARDFLATITGPCNFEEEYKVERNDGSNEKEKNDENDLEKNDENVQKKKDENDLEKNDENVQKKKEKNEKKDENELEKKDEWNGQEKNNQNDLEKNDENMEKEKTEQKKTCIRKLAVFIASFLRRRLSDLEKCTLATITGPCRFEKKHKNELIARQATREIREASVVILSNSAGMTNSSCMQFMKYIHNAHEVQSVLLKYVSLQGRERTCNHKKHSCNCIVISEVEKINMMTQVREDALEDKSQVLLPSLKCLENGCHRCSRKLLHRKIDDNLNVKFSCALCYALDFEFTTPTETEPLCICIPVSNDKWTKFLVRSLKYKDQEDKGAIVAAVDSLQSYLDNRGKDRDEDSNKWTKLLVRSLKCKDEEDKGAIVDSLQSYLDNRGKDRDEDSLQSYLDNRGKDGEEDKDRDEEKDIRAEEEKDIRAEEIKYKTLSLIVTRLVEILVNLLLTVFFKVDGFSSSLAARRAVRSYVVDSKGSGLPANVFLTSGLVVVNSGSVCQVLKFRGNTLGSISLLLMVGFVNLVCALAWAVVLIKFNGRVGKWYEVPSMPPSKPRVFVIIGAICIGIVMDCFEFSSLVTECLKIFRNGRDFKKVWEEIKKDKRNQCMRLLRIIWKEIKKDKRNKCMILLVIILQIAFAVVVALSLNKGIGRWIYGALQVLVWVKWAIGSLILGAYSPEYVSTIAERDTDADGRVILKYSSASWVDEGTLVYCSSFFLNAVMVGVMGDWTGIWSTWK